MHLAAGHKRKHSQLAKKIETVYYICYKRNRYATNESLSEGLPQPTFPFHCEMAVAGIAEDKKRQENRIWAEAIIS